MASVVIFYSISVDSPVGPDEPLPPLPKIPRGSLVVLEGRAPIWRYGFAFHKLHGSPAAAIDVYDHRLGPSSSLPIRRTTVKATF